MKIIFLFAIQLLSVFGNPILENNTVHDDASISDCPLIASRKEWEARNVTGHVPLWKTPTPYVVIHHGGIKHYCHEKESCAKIVKSYQDLHINDNGWLDIGYQFVIGEDGIVYEGRGWDYVGAHAIGFNTQSIGICIIGDFSHFLPNAIALTALKSLIKCGVTMGKIHSKYKIIGHRQTRDTLCPGDFLYDYIKQLPTWTNNPKSC